MKDAVSQRPRMWAVILAAGRGTRMTEVTHVLCGRPLPKQFAPLVSDRTMLQETMARIAPVIPPERTVIVVAEGHEALARTQLADTPGVEVVSQPRDLGTGPGVLLPLTRVSARDPDATVAVFPSDHHFERPEPFRAALRAGAIAAEEAPAGVALLGARAEHPASDLGWIVPSGRGPAGVSLVGKFVEKPPEKTARSLMEAGGLWNTMVMVGAASAFWRLGRAHMPLQTQAFRHYLERGARSHEARAHLELLYRTIAPAHFSRGVLERAAGLAVVPIVNSGWFDCGTPESFVEWLHKTSDRFGVLPRLSGNAGSPWPARAA